MFTAILMILIAIALVLSAILVESSVVIAYDGTVHHIITEVVVLCSMLVGVLLVGFQRVESRVRAKAKIKQLQEQSAQQSGEVARLGNELTALQATLAKKEAELARSKDELIRALQTPVRMDAPAEAVQPNENLNGLVQAIEEASVEG
ncbi:MAG: hypothetical protein Q4A52_01755 [Bacillota bacterium]|nr:hypothetical protein [Bacillota bacterium]